MRIDNGLQYWHGALGTWVVGIKRQGHREAPFAVGGSGAFAQLEPASSCRLAIQARNRSALSGLSLVKTDHNGLFAGSLRGLGCHAVLFIAAEIVSPMVGATRRIGSPQSSDDRPAFGRYRALDRQSHQRTNEGPAIGRIISSYAVIDGNRAEFPLEVSMAADCSLDAQR